MLDCFSFAENDLVGRGQFKCICYSPKSSAALLLMLTQEDNAVVYDILIAASLGKGLQ